VDIRTVLPQSPDALRLLADYLDDLEWYVDGWSQTGYVDAPPEELGRRMVFSSWGTRMAKRWHAVPRTSSRRASQR
jgi:hypothetical protein